MKARIITFTNTGYKLGRQIKDALSGYEAELIFKGRKAASVTAAAEDSEQCPEPSTLSLSEICRESFDRTIPVIFIGAAGIAVRSIAPYVRDKLTDPPVLVVDELGQFCIPVLSGHAGGANGLAAQISESIGAVPVLTTATDINEAFPVDVFARENGLSIMNRDGIARVSTSALEGRPVTISIKDYPPRENVDVLITDHPSRGNVDELKTDGPDRLLAAGDSNSGSDHRTLRGIADIVLCPKKYALGMGCRRGKTFGELRDFALKVLEENGIELRDVGCIATIDIKKDEEGLRALSQAWKMPFITFEAEMLAKVQGDFSSSETVLEKVGVDNVCERAAALAAGVGSEIIVYKTAENGMTAAVALRKQKS